MTAGFTSDSQAEAKQTLARLARELAALSYVGNSSYTGLVQRRTQIITQLRNIYERELRVLKSGTSVARKRRNKRFPTTLQVALESGVHVMLELLEDSLHSSPRVCQRVLRRLGRMLESLGLLSLSVRGHPPTRRHTLASLGRRTRATHTAVLGRSRPLLPPPTVLATD